MNSEKPAEIETTPIASNQIASQRCEQRGYSSLIGEIIRGRFDIAPDLDDGEAVRRPRIKSFLDAVWSNGLELYEAVRNAEHQRSRSPISPVDEEVKPSLNQAARIAFKVSPFVSVYKASRGNLRARRDKAERAAWRY